MHKYISWSSSFIIIIVYYAHNNDVNSDDDDNDDRMMRNDGLTLVTWQSGRSDVSGTVVAA